MATIPTLLSKMRKNYVDVAKQSTNDIVKIQFCSTHNEMREIAARICRNYLHGVWKVVDPKDIEFRRISGGLSNFLYYLALPEDTSKLKEQLKLCEAPPPGTKKLFNKTNTVAINEPKKVLLRIYGQVFGERNMDAIVTQSVIFTLLSERHLGPKLHGVFSGGRIEEYIPGRSLITRELADPVYSMKIAENMAAIHLMDVPLTKEPTWIWKTMTNWLKTANSCLGGDIEAKPRNVRKIIKHLKKIDFEDEIEWLKTYVKAVDSPVVFCHNDMQEGNILLLDTTQIPRTESNKENIRRRKHNSSATDEENTNSLADNNEPKLVLIDYEYCAYNYRAFDIANHFQEWIYEYTNPDPPFFYILEDSTPTLNQRESFIYAYLKRFYKGTDHAPGYRDLNRLLEEVEAFTLASHLFWCLWSIMNGNTTQIKFGYWEYAMARIENYQQMKKEIQDQQTPINSNKRKRTKVDK